MAVVNRISEQEYRELALSDTDHLWELWDGVPREKPSMSMRHDNVSFRLGHFLQIQLDWDEYRVNVNGGKTRLSPRSYYIPDVVVIPSTYQLRRRDEAEGLPRARRCRNLVHPSVRRNTDRLAQTIRRQLRRRAIPRRGDPHQFAAQCRHRSGCVARRVVSRKSRAIWVRNRALRRRSERAVNVVRVRRGCQAQR
jgi:hypothetical protein